MTTQSKIQRRSFLQVPLGAALAAVSSKAFAAETTIQLEPLSGVRIRVLVENLANGEFRSSPFRYPISEWGLSLWIEAGDTHVLFDTGLGTALFHNIKTYDVDLAQIGVIALSHNHLDHTGGLMRTLEMCSGVSVYAHPSAFRPRYYSQNEKTVKTNDTVLRETVQKKAGIVDTVKPTEIVKGIYATGEVPRLNDFETFRFNLYLDEAMTERDQILDDQSLFFKTPQGLVLVMGCAHAGIVNTMDYVARLTGETSFHAVIGGTHLESASTGRLDKTVEALKKYHVEKIMLMHCTGLKAYNHVYNAFPDKCSWPGAGSLIQLG